MDKARERAFQDHIVHALQASGWLVGESTKYDRERALYLEAAVRLRESQIQGAAEKR